MTGTGEYASGWACLDCTMLLANGETPPELGQDETAEYLERVDRHTVGTDVALGQLLGEDDCECETWDCDDHREGCERQDFSWSSCDVCGSTLGGSRDAVKFWLEAAS
jgi:hypothetical protein